MYDVAVIGAGVVGASTARELSKYKLRICILEKENDVACGTSKANSGVVHAGFDAEPDTLMASLNVKGNQMFDCLSKELEFPFQRIGSFVVAFDESQVTVLKNLMEKGLVNGVPGLQVISGEELVKMEPEVNNSAVAALYAPTGGITCPYEMTISLAENAVMNGVELFTGKAVTGIKKMPDGSFTIKTNSDEIRTKYIVNAAGLYSDQISSLAGAEEFQITPRKGEYCLFDRSRGGFVSRVIFQVPGPFGKGVLVTPTVDGNILVGPNAYGINDKSDFETTRTGIEQILKTARRSVPGLPERDIITSFSGIRAVSGDDFIIESSKKVKGLINVIGICSPGLTASPAIGVYVKELLCDTGLELQYKEHFNPKRKRIPRFREMTMPERLEMISKNPLYGRIICRCEMVTEGEIVDAIKRPIGAKDLDSIKRRVRAGMGRCQGGFCSPRVTEILSRETGIPMTQITKFGGDSFILKGKNR